MGLQVTFILESRRSPLKCGDADESRPVSDAGESRPVIHDVQPGLMGGGTSRLRGGSSETVPTEAAGHDEPSRPSTASSLLSPHRQRVVRRSLCSRNATPHHLPASQPC